MNAADMVFNAALLAVPTAAAVAVWAVTEIVEAWLEGRKARKERMR